VFWLILLFVLVAFFQTLGLAQVSVPLNLLLGQVLTFLPRLVAAAVLILIAWVLATVLRLVVTRALHAARVDERVGEQMSEERSEATIAAGSSDPATSPQAGGLPPTRAAAGRVTTPRVPLSRTLGDAVYWLVFLLFLPAILDALQLGGLLTPVTVLLNKILDFIPNLIAAALILVIGWFVAGLVRGSIGWGPARGLRRPWAAGACPA
jgi:flagellar biosynthesis protein FliQ